MPRRRRSRSPRREGRARAAPTLQDFQEIPNSFPSDAECDQSPLDLAQPLACSRADFEARIRKTDARVLALLGASSSMKHKSETRRRAQEEEETSADVREAEKEEEEEEDDGLTAAQRLAARKRREREAAAPALDHETKKELYNAKLAKLSEHHDMPRISGA